MTRRFLLSLALCFIVVPPTFAAEVYRDCINLVTDYAYYRDRFDAAGFSNLFTEDATLTVGGQSWAGRDAIRQRIQELDSDTTIRHLMSTIRIEPVDALHATGVSYATIYSAAPGATTVEGFAVIGEYHDEFVLTADGWKIQSRVLHTVFGYNDM